MPTTDFTRREFIVTTLASGFALAVQPVSAQTVTTDTSGLVAGEVKIPVLGGQIPAYHAMPKSRTSGRSHPVVLVVHEIFGVHEHIKDICRRLAKLGYLAIAPELFARQGDVSKLSSIQDIIPVVAKVPDAQVLADLDATVAWAKQSDQGNTHALGITGFCWGGRIVWLYSAHNPQLKAGVAWYGRLVGPTDDCIRRTRWISPAHCTRRCSASMVVRTPAFPARPSSRCAKHSRPPTNPPRSSSTPTPRTASTPITVTATARSRRPTAGGERRSGSRHTAWRSRVGARSVSIATRPGGCW